MTFKRFLFVLALVAGVVFFIRWLGRRREREEIYGSEAVEQKPTLAA